MFLAVGLEDISAALGFLGPCLGSQLLYKVIEPDRARTCAPGEEGVRSRGTSSSFFPSGSQAPFSICTVQPLEFELAAAEGAFIAKVLPLSHGVRAFV